MKHEISFLSSAQPRLLPRSGPHQTCSSGPHAARSDGAPVCSCLPEPSHKQAESGPDKPELAQIWAALHFYFSGLDPASSGLSVHSWPTPETKSAQIWQTEVSGPGAITPRGVWAASMRLIQFWLNLLSLQLKILTSNILMFHLWATRGNTEARLHHVEYLRNFSTCRHETLERLWSRRRRLLTSVTPWFFMCSRQKIKVNNFLKLQRLVD